MQTPSQLLIRGGRVIDPASGFDQTADVFVAEGIVAEIGRIRDVGNGAAVIDAEGCIVSPGLIDIHVHFREPGFEHKETIASGSLSAVRGGFTTVCCMPNTRPPLDSPATLALVEKKAREAGLCNVHCVAAATAGRKGEAAGAIASLAEAGAVGFSDDGDCIMSARVMRDVLQLCREHDRPFMQHCQDVNLTAGGVMNAGPLQMRLGLGAWPAVAEEIIIERDIRLNRDIGARYHVQHLSSAGSVDIVREAQRRGHPVSAEATPHHLLLTEEACADYDTLAKMNPPLRSDSDSAAIKAGIADGTINILATDHAPHSVEEKAVDFEIAPFGIIGLDDALGLYARALIDDGVISWPRMLSMMTIHPARLVGLDRSGAGSLTIGGRADVTVIDPEHAYEVDLNELGSRSRNCPFGGWKLTARAVATVVGGRVVHRVGERVAAAEG